MKGVLVVVLVAVAVAVRVGMWRRRAARRASGDTTRARAWRLPVSHNDRPIGGDVGLVAWREVRERVRGRIFQVGTLVVLLIVVGAIVIPSFHGPSTPVIQTVGVVGSLTAPVEEAAHQAGVRAGDQVDVDPLATQAEALQLLRSGHLDAVVVGGGEIVVNEPTSSKNSPADAVFIQELASYLGVMRAYRDAALTPAQINVLSHVTPVPVRALEGSGAGPNQAPSVIGLVLLFFMLTQYCSWTLIGVMQEKSSRVVEVLLATLRPLQLLGGKVLGIGLVAIAQAALVVATALIASAAVGSNVLHGTGPTLLASELLWLLLGYAFYCWLYAAAGSTAERQDQVQTLAFPLSIPILVSYIFSITVASSGHPDLAFKVLAYLPPTAPFCMPVLVALGDVQWWQFVASVLVSLVGIAAMASFAARVYRRAILRSGGRSGVRGLWAMARR